MTAPTHRRGRSEPLDATELADAALTAAMVVALLAAGRVLAAGSLFQVIASIVVAVLAARRRTRAVAIATAAAVTIAPILGGLGPVTQAFLAGVFGWCGGQALKRGWGRLRSIGFSLLIAWPAMVCMVMFVFPAVAINGKLRSLVFENVENQADGFANIVSGIGSLFDLVGLSVVSDAADSVGSGLRRVAEFLIDNWLLLIPATEFVYSILYAWFIRAVAGAILRRLDRSLVEPLSLDLAPSLAPDPVPVRVRAEHLLRNGVPVTGAVDLDVRPGEHIVVQGPNGAGKSTLLDALSGLDNVDAVSRPGPVGLGSLGGTARVGQRPEAQVVGTTVEEDLRWGLDVPELDTRQVLSEMGLDVPGDRPTSELSGGELQRLALASALRRHPRLLLVDEVTSMLDPDEQVRITARLQNLDGAAIVRTTHRNDASSSDRQVHLDGRAGFTAAAGAESPRDDALRTVHSSVSEPRLLRLRGVGFAHNARQPWAEQVLSDIDLSIHRYEMVVVEGRNGSGKTTLARIIAGLLRPTEGTIEAAKGVQRALAHQHVRLQLLRATVDEELASLSGVRSHHLDETSDDERQRTRALNLATTIDLFGLERLLERRIDELSGGEQRRVLLAGLVARGVSVLVLDEPLAGLDASGRADLAATLDQVRLAGTSVVVVSHDVDWTPDHVDQHLRLGDGRLGQLAR